ncbi:MAG TPA: hypothetical protein VHE55_19820 [Fimbriimonadaceae bacterium]|nr:hypothetical protein [Fimbriimonadaceae bacterium]
MRLRLPGLAIASIVCAYANAASPFKVVDLGMLPNGMAASAAAINNQSVAAGQCIFQNGSGNYVEHAVIFKNGQVYDVVDPFYPNEISTATGVDRFGNVVGIHEQTGFVIRGGQLFDPNTIPGTSWSTAARINSNGIFVGQVCIQQSPGVYIYHGYEFVNGQMADFNGLIGGDFSQATAVNDSGEVVGYGRDALGRWINFLITGDPNSPLTQVFNLGTLGGENAIPYSIDSRGDVAGGSYLPNNVYHPFLYRNGHMTDLGILPEAQSGYATGVDTSGVVVGNDQPSGYAGSIPFAYVNGKLSNLNSLIPANSGWTLITAADINEKGEIVGSAYLNGAQHAYKLVRNLNPITGTASGH